MRIRVIGAAGGEVTGSACFVQTKRANVLVDCGKFQGGRAAEAKNRPPTRSPMAIEATKLYVRHYLKDPELFDEALLKYLRQRPMREDLKTLKATVTAEESKAINGCPGPCLVMAGAGICTGGRILHHFKENLWRPKTHVVIVGYQGRGSLGRRLADGVESVSILGHKIVVRAQVHTLGGFSAHAGQTDLLKWFGWLAPSRPRVVLIHRENGPRSKMAGLIRQRHGLPAVLPKQGDAIDV